MPHQKRYSSSSESSEDNVPLRKLNAECDLYEEVQENCEFCGEVLDNKYDLLVHNAHHIIIPLINQDIFSCKECHKCFPTETLLSKHMTVHNVKKQTNNILKGLTTIERNIEEKDRLMKVDEKHSLPYNGEKLQHKLVIGNKIAKKNDQTEKFNDNIGQKDGQTIRKDGKIISDQFNKKPEINEQNFNTDTVIINISDSDSEDDKQLDVSKVLKNIVSNQPVVSCEGTVTKLINTTNVKNILYKEPVIVLQDTISSLLKTSQSGIDRSAVSVQKTYISEFEKFLPKHGKETHVADKTINRQCVSRLDTQNLPIKPDIQNHSQNGDLNMKSRDLLCSEEFILPSPEPTEPNKPQKLFPNENVTSNIKNRFVFEDDVDDLFEDPGYILPDSPNSVPITIGNLPGNNDLLMINEKYQAKMVLGSKMTETETWSPSIHYEELILPKEVKCHICGVVSPNRYQSIIHSTKHVKLKTRIVHQMPCPVCDMMITGNYHALRAHIEMKHPNARIKKNRAKVRCQTCGLNYYHEQRHHNNYHLIYVCRLCGVRFGREEERVEHFVNTTHDNSYFETLSEERRLEGLKVQCHQPKYRKVCEICFMFLKDLKYKYVFLKDFSEIGKSQKCYRCQKQFFEVKIIKVISWKSQPQTYLRNKATRSSNEDRLKNIQKRLKMINKLSKF